MPEKGSQRGKVLVVEDEAYVRDSLSELLRSRGFEVLTAASAEAGLAALGRAPVDVVLTDLKMPGMNGFDLIQRAQAVSPEIPIVVLTGHGTISSAVECIKAGATDYILKPADPGALEMALDRAIASRALKREVAYLRAGAGLPGSMTEPVGQSPAWNKVTQMIRAAAPTDSTVLLLGESGTGKELLAGMLHRRSARSGGPFVRVNCAAVPMEMWESEFFGHRKGSFTGATADRDGRFRLAHRGTLFMDEIGTMPLTAQAKILRVLQDGEFDRLGDEQSTRVDVRVVAATNSDLETEVAAGRFRQDLYFRLNVVRIEVPPLRNRPEDIPLLIMRFVQEISARLGRKAPSVAPEMIADLQAYPWPGNVRELRNVLERALILDAGDPLTSLDLPPVQGFATAAAPVSAATPGSDLNLRSALGRSEKEMVLEALRRSAGVRKEAARLLGIDQRNLGYYLKKHGIDPDQVTE